MPEVSDKLQDKIFFRSLNEISKTENPVSDDIAIFVVVEQM